MKSYYLKYIAKYAGPVLYYSGVPWLASPFFSGLGHVLMFHRVLPKKQSLRIHNHSSLEVTPEYLEQVIQYYLRNKYSIISIEELPLHMQSKSREKFVVFTFDDGYFDNLEYALPVFQKYKVPFTIYVCNDFPNNKVFLWWYLLEELLLKTNRCQLISSNKTYEFETGGVYEKESAFYQIRYLFNSGAITDSDLKSLFDKYLGNVSEMTNNMCLSWDDIQKLSDDKLVTIGAHTVSHAALKQLSDEACLDEMRNSKLEIENYINKEVKNFAYPFGSNLEVGRRDMKMAEKVGFKTSVTTQLGNIFSMHRNHMMALPRLTVNALSNKYVLSLMSSGLYPLIDNRFKKHDVNRYK